MVEHVEFFDFPIEHKSFYDQFNSWRFAKNKECLQKEGIYYLLAGKPVPRCLQLDPNGILIGSSRFLYF